MPQIQPKNPDETLVGGERPARNSRDNHLEKEGATIEEAEGGEKPIKVEDLPSAREVIEALGIPDWEKLEKKAIRRLDMTLMPAFLLLYLFNYLDRAALAYVTCSPITFSRKGSLTMN